jgi:hypothetical protein
LLQVELEVLEVLVVAVANFTEPLALADKVELVQVTVEVLMVAVETLLLTPVGVLQEAVTQVTVVTVAHMAALAENLL